MIFAAFVINNQVNLKGAPKSSGTYLKSEKNAY